MKPNLIAEVLAELKKGVTVRELALRYSLSEAAIRSYKTGRRGNGEMGRPRALTPEEEATCFIVWSLGEASLYELAAIHCVTPQTMKNILRRQAPRHGEAWPWTQQSVKSSHGGQ